MSSATLDLSKKRCAACEGDLAALAKDQLPTYLAAVPTWKITTDGKRLRREWSVKDFATGLDFFQRVGRIAEDENHHPDLHLSNYRLVTIEIWTHALGGLSENDFILAAKIDKLPVELKR
jgi:4a-hydroxytetrahydrobiopterin dehydratase